MANRKYLEWAIRGMEQEIKTLRQRIADIEPGLQVAKSELAGGLQQEPVRTAASARTAPVVKRRRRRKVNADTRQLQSERAKARWAKRNTLPEVAISPKSARKPRTRKPARAKATEPKTDSGLVMNDLIAPVTE